MVDQLTEFRRIQSQDNNETFDRATDSLEAIRNFLAAISTGLTFYGIVTNIPGANQFDIAALVGLGETKFVNWGAFVFRDAGGAGAAPQGETRLVTTYVSATGRFTTAAYTAAVAVGDEIILVHPSILPAVQDGLLNELMRDVVGNKTDTIPAMNLAPGNWSIPAHLKAILERLGATPADPDDSLHTVVGQRDGTSAAGVIKGTDTLVALLKQVTKQTLFVLADVTGWTDANNFASTDLAGYENDFFAGWYVFVVRDDGGASAAPQGEYRLATDYVSATGAMVHNAFSANMAVGDQVMMIHPMLFEILTIRGGAETLESLDDELDAVLDLARNPDSGSTVMDGTEQTLYEESDTVPWEFHGGYLDWTGANFGAGEDTTVKVYIKVVSGGTYRLIYSEVFLAAALPAQVCTPHPRDVNTQVVPGRLMNVYGVKVTAQQAAIGAGWNTLVHEWFDAKRGS